MKRSIKFTLLVVLCFILAISQINVRPVAAEPDASIIRVAPGGTDTASCGSATTPCRAIQYAINKALSGDTILLAAGSYGFVAGNSQDPVCKTYNIKACVSCIYNKHLTIKGGYTTSDWANPDPSTNLTILDGGGQYRVISLLSSSPANPTGSLLLDGVTIQNGLAQGGIGSNHLSTSGYGGGLFVQNAPLTMNNVILKNNQAIGGTNSSNAEGGVGVGGGMAVNGLQTGSIIINHVTFDSNTSLGGNVKDRGAYSFAGGLYTYATRIEITDMILNNNLTQAGSTTTGSGSDSNGDCRCLRRRRFISLWF